MEITKLSKLKVTASPSKTDKFIRKEFASQTHESFPYLLAMIHLACAVLSFVPTSNML